MVDPIQGFLVRKVDFNKSNQVLRVLKPLVDLSERYDFCWLLTRHLRKSGAAKAIYSVER